MNRGKKRFVLFLILFLVVAGICPAASNEVRAAAKVKLSKSKMTLAVGKSKKLTVKNGKGWKISWKSSKKKVATISKSGKVKAKKAGKAVIIATLKKKGKKSKKLRCRVTVQKALTEDSQEKQASEQSSQESQSGQSETTSANTADSDDTTTATVDKVPAGQFATGVDTAELTPEIVYQRMMAVQETYPEKTPWTNENSYDWAGGNPDDVRVPTGGSGCAAFNFVLSDAAFGNLPARYYDISEIAATDIRVGDIIRYVPKQGGGQEHSVSILAIEGESFIVAEGNYNHYVHWGRKVEMSEIFGAEGTGIYVLTRYPA